MVLFSVPASHLIIIGAAFTKRVLTVAVIIILRRTTMFIYFLFVREHFNAVRF